VFVAIAVGANTAIAVLCAAMAWSVSSPEWAMLAPLAMWAPALARLVTRSTVDRGFTSTLTLNRWGDGGALVILRPLAIPLLVYGAAYAIAWSVGAAQWSPGEGRWTSAPQILANLVINLSILVVYGTFTATGEELGWRGYLQPRLDAAGVRYSVLVVWVVQLAYHAPLMIGAGYLGSDSLVQSLLLFAIGDLPVTFLIAWLAYRARSLWPAVFLHSFHNTVSQWLFAKFFIGDENPLVLGEGGILPMAGYVIVGVVVYVAMRRRGLSWAQLASAAFRADAART
ncbi:MAG TPA: CPBP family intramembrane glutamic endopeptidase, partial [Gammaproteobacteria bacterium]|nr:CPBP family intramembrane glutamic endopeptidase [Gammaproteobacteria bacterium]